MRRGHLHPSLSYSSHFGYKVSCSTFGITACKFLPSCGGFHRSSPTVRMVSLSFVFCMCGLSSSQVVMVQRWLCSFQNVSLQIFLPPHFNECVQATCKWHWQSSPHPKPAFKIEGTVRCKDWDFWPWWWGNTLFRDIRWYRAGCRFILDWDTVVVLQFGTAALVKNFDTPNKSSVFYGD